MKAKPQDIEDDDAGEDAGGGPAAFAYFFVAQSRDSAVLAEVLRRFTLEFGVRNTPAPVTTSRSDGSAFLLAGLKGVLDGDRLATFQQHAGRVQRLLQSQWGPGAVSIQIGHTTFGKVTLAWEHDAPGRIYLRQGVWAGVLAGRDPSGEWRWYESESAPCREIRIAPFFDALAGPEDVP